MAERSSVAIPTDLLEQVERGNVLLFIGEGLAREQAGEPPLEGLAAELAARAEIADAERLSFAELAQAYEDERGRQSLVDLVLRRFQAVGDAPLPAHRLIAGLAQCGVLATTDLSGRLERAFRATLMTESYALSPRPIARLWSNKLLVMLDLADLAHPAERPSTEQRAQIQAQLAAAASTTFFGEDFTWAAQQASDWLEQHARELREDRS
jgi:hypothetical protein